jgi:hypothetical protein
MALAGALALSLVLYPYLVFAFALGATSDSTEMLAVVFGVPALLWAGFAIYIVRKWRQGWRSVWKFPLIVIIRGLFWPALLLLLSESSRRALLPRRPAHAAGYCVACGRPLVADARYCASCGAAVLVQ